MRGSAGAKTQRGMLSSEASWSPDAREESKDEDVVTNMSLGGICDQVMKPTEEARQDLSTDMLLILFKTMSIHDLAVVLLVSRSRACVMRSSCVP